MRLTDYVMKRLKEHGVSQVFMVTGGGAMHLDDSVGTAEGIEYLCNHHEQACAIGAEGYARMSGKLGVCVVTSGPGGTNTLTGVIGQWTDSVPVLYLSGQIKYETSIESCREIGLRQLGDQEINIVDIVKPVTKFAAMVTDPLEVKKLVDKAIYLATHGRPGPVWLDFPLNVQGAVINESQLHEYKPEEDKVIQSIKQTRSDVKKLLQLLEKSERPVIVAGHGIRIAGAQKIFLDTIERLGIPVLSTFNGFDLISSDHPLFVGRIGTLGSRAGNFALQNSDLMISIGSRNNIRQISYNWQSYARAAKKVIVDVDLAELKKPTITPDLPICVDAKVFVDQLNSQISKVELPNFKEWLDWCHERKKKYPVVIQEYKQEKGSVNLYYFMESLTKILKKDSVVVAGNGSACVGLFQAGVMKAGQRMFWNSGCASMGYDLPAAIGACIANDKKTVVCIAGDGSLQMNLQELITVVYNKLPIKIFYLNNDGYISIRQTQEAFFNGRIVGSDEGSGVGFPDIVKVAKAYGLRTEVISTHADMKDKIKAVIKEKEPILCEVKLSKNYKFAPKLSSYKRPDGKMISKPLEDLFPFLDRKEFIKNMIVKIIDEE